MTLKNYNTKTKLLSIILSAAMISTSAAGIGPFIVQPQINADAAETTTDYGLMEKIQDGTILHCFDWKYTDIIDEIPNIAKAGFTSVQTSPAQLGAGTGIWWWLYQPMGFSIQTNDLGTKEELTQLCTEAEKYGIKVIVDVVANHLNENHTQTEIDDTMYHTKTLTSSGSRYDVTHYWLGGSMPDLKSENTTVQNVIINYVQELKSVGVDGIRWDAVKHIQLPSESFSGEDKCNFFSTVLDQSMYNYGEILGGPGGSSSENALMKEYSNYMSLTDDTYGKKFRDAFTNGTTESSNGKWSNNGISTDKLVYWGESHDTWSNNKDYGYSNELSQNIIDRTYAIMASRNGASALYYSRPKYNVKNDIIAGVKGSEHFKSPEVAAVNHFHNAMNGQTEYYTYNNDCAVVCRKKGAVIAAWSGENKTVSVPNGGNTTETGIYIDEITGNTWTVTSDNISGKIGSTGIAVLYKQSDFKYNLYAVPETNTEFTTDTLDVTFKALNISDAHYTTSENQSGSLTDGQTITIGGSSSYNSEITLTVSGTAADGTVVTQEYKYQKKDPESIIKAYFDNSSYGWSNVYAYIYKDGMDGAEMYYKWPGKKLSVGKSGFYEMEIPDNFTSAGKIIFSDGVSGTTKRYPAENDGGMDIGGKSMIFQKGNIWTGYSSIFNSILSAVPENGSEFTTDKQNITLYTENVTNPVYFTSEDNTEKSFSDGETISVGAYTDYGNDITLTLKGTDKSGNNISQTYTYSKKKEFSVYFKNIDNWSIVKAYVYDSANNTMSVWPGTVMEEVSDNLYKIDIDESFVNNGKIIFNNRTDSNSNSYSRYPKDDGTHSVAGFEIGNTSEIFVSKDDTKLNPYYSEEYYAHVKGYSISLEGDIALNYYIAVPDSYVNLHGIKAEITAGDKTDTISLNTTDKISTSDNYNSCYKLTAYLNAGQMEDEITLTLKDSENKVIDLCSSVTEKYEDNKAVKKITDYINEISESETTETITKELKNLVNYTEIYGAYAAQLLNKKTVNTDNLPNVTRTSESEIVSAVQEHKLKKTSGTLPDGITLLGASLLLDSQTSFRIYFKSEKTIPEITIDGVNVNPTEKSGVYYIQKSNISAQDLDTKSTVKFGNCELQFSALTYVYNVLNTPNADENTKQAVMALYDYNLYANNYFDNKQ